MIGNARGSHTSPGIYTREIDVTYAVKSLGITTLGVVGETEKGPAFEPIRIEDWSEFKTYFGGTNPTKFKESGYPRYELPYIAKSYLSESKQLEVCRVLGLSGYNAGPAWLLTLDGYVFAVLRSRGHYERYSAEKDDRGCNTGFKFDNLVFNVPSVGEEGQETVKIAATAKNATSKDCSTVSSSFDGTYELTATSDYPGRFTLEIKVGTDSTLSYSVSLNPADKNYIIEVLGTSNEDGSAPLFVEELYDVALMQMLENNTISSGATWSVKGVEAIKVKPICRPVDGILDILTPTRSMVGKSYLCVKDIYTDIQDTELKPNITLSPGTVYTVKNQYNDTTKKHEYVYEVVKEKDENDELVDLKLDEGKHVFVLSEGLWYMQDGTDVLPMTVDMNDYREQYRCASTPWLVSELKGDGKSFEMKKLMRFHTISDGNAANGEVKISIENISYEEGTFDVLIRAFNDTDAVPTILERFTRCTMQPGTSNYVGLKIGTLDGEYMNKSKYVTVEIPEDETIQFSVPCGFEGYPLRKYDDNLNSIKVSYNTKYNSDVREKKQYFGLSNTSGVDIDVFNYKGVKAYISDVKSNGFHLDCRFDEFKQDATFTLDGEVVSGWTCVENCPENLTTGGALPIIGMDAEMIGSIYEDKKLRKFTVYPYGGFDGWDIYRGSRSTGNDFKENKYKGVMVNGVGDNLSEVTYYDGLNLKGKAITSDYYAFLAGARQFANPFEYEINVFATPGIDYVNDNYLSQEILDMIEDERGDSIYVMTTPDKPKGATDAVSEMYTPDEVVINLEDSDVDSSYATTYYPWVKYFDTVNSTFINLPPTKDVVRNFAYTDNIKYPWFAPAGIERGSVECSKAHYVTKLEDEDTLYSGLINPIKTFAQDGVKIWGNMTMYSKDTPLNRVNVRRLMLRVKKLIEQACKVLIFEPNDMTVREQFLGLVNPILSDIRANRGITDFKIEVDNSKEAIDRHELPAVIWIKPAPTLEYIDLTFVITPEGASFE